MTLVAAETSPEEMSLDIDLAPRDADEQFAVARSVVVDGPEDHLTQAQHGKAS